MVEELIPRPPGWIAHADPIESRGGEQVDETIYNTPDPVWNGMPRSDFKRFGRYLRRAADMLGLRDWAFNLRWTPCEDGDAMASINCISGQKRASIFLTMEFADLPEHQQRHALIHELLHCHFNAMDTVLYTACGPLGSVAFGILQSNHHNEVEMAVDAIASEIAQLFPLITPDDGD